GGALIMAGTAVVSAGPCTGIGAACALHLDKEGFRVFAGVRRQSDADALRSKASPRLTPISLDVADTLSISTAAGAVAGAVGEAGAGRAGHQLRRSGLWAG